MQNTWKRVILKTLKLRLRNYFYEISEKSSKKWFPSELNSTAKNSSCIPAGSCSTFQMECLNFQNMRQHTYSKLVGIFSHFSQLHHSCSLKLSYWISALHLGHFQHCNLGKFVWRMQIQTGSHGFYFPCCNILILQSNFPNFGMEILPLLSAKSLWCL